MHDRRYQYKVETVKHGVFGGAEKQDAMIQDRLNRLGTEGWEFVQMVQAYGGYPRIILRK